MPFRPAFVCSGCTITSLSVLQQADLESQTRQVAEREAATFERAAALQRRADEVAQAERDTASGHEALEAATAARVRHQCGLSLNRWAGSQLSRLGARRCFAISRVQPPDILVAAVVLSATTPLGSSHAHR